MAAASSSVVLQNFTKKTTYVNNFRSSKKRKMFPIHQHGALPTDAAYFISSQWASQNASEYLFQMSYFLNVSLCGRSRKRFLECLCQRFLKIFFLPCNSTKLFKTLAFHVCRLYALVLIYNVLEALQHEARFCLDLEHAYAQRLLPVKRSLYAVMTCTVIAINVL